MSAAVGRIEAALKAKGSRGRGGSWTCPAHGDRRPSLSVGEGRSGAAVYCHAGCPTAEVMEALGLTLADLYDEPRRGRPIEAVYPYADEQGRLLLEVVRLEGKFFKRRRLDPSHPEADEAGYVWSAQGVRRVLYRLPAVLAGVAAGRTVYVAEGEKDVRALERVGEVATCNPGGAGRGKWRPEFSEALRGAEVVVIADRDEEGREHAGRVCGALAGIAKSVTTVQAAEGKDAHDHLEQHGLGVEGFVPLETRSADTPTGGRKLIRVDVGKMISTPPPPVPWVVEPLLVRGCLTLLAGREGMGKSLLAQAVSAGVLTGDDAGPFSCRPGRVLLIDGENGESELHRRVRALGIDAAAAEGLAVYLTEAPSVLNDLAELEEAIARERPDLVVVDAFRTLWTGKENDSDATGPAIDGLRNLARRCDVAILLLHHASRQGDYRGSTAIGAGCQIIVGLGHQPDDEEPDRFFLVNPKLRMAPRWATKWIRLAVELNSLVCLEEAEAPEDQKEELARPAPKRAEVAPAVLAAIDGASTPPTTADACRAVGRPPKDQTVRRVLKHFEDAGRIVRDGLGWRGVNAPQALKGRGTPDTPPSTTENPHEYRASECVTQVDTQNGPGTLADEPDWREEMPADLDPDRPFGGAS